MDKQKPRFDIVNEILEACILAYPLSSFIISLYKQYQERGSLSKKQLQGLYGKAEKIEDLAPGKLGTLEAVIKRMPTRYKSELPPPQPEIEKQPRIGEMIAEILARYPEHKRVIFLKSKYDSNTQLTAAEVADLERFRKLIK